MQDMGSNPIPSMLVMETCIFFINENKLLEIDKDWLLIHYLLLPILLT